MSASLTMSNLRIRQLEDNVKTLTAANSKLQDERVMALDYLERHTDAWPSADARLDAETRGFLIHCGRGATERAPGKERAELPAVLDRLDVLTKGTYAGLYVHEILEKLRRVLLDDDHVRAGPPSPCPPMGMPPLDPNAKIGPCLAPLQPAAPEASRLDAWMRCTQQQLQPINNRVGPGFGKPLDPVAMRGNDPPVCRRCNDSHWVVDSHTERLVMCTACPVPCDKCRKDGNGPYCATTPCSCDCHKPKDPQ